MDVKKIAIRTAISIVILVAIGATLHFGLGAIVRAHGG